MPKTPIDYSKTIIYKLVHNEDYDNANIYIGSTTDFIKRKWGHKTRYYNENSQFHNLKIYQYIRENGGWECFNMIEIEKYPCNDGNEARAREEYWKCYFNSQLNSRKAFRTDEQNIIYKKEYAKEYVEQHKDKIKEQQQLKYENNKEYILNKVKTYYENNKDKINENRKDKIMCECGCLTTKINIIRHHKTKKHIDLINKNICVY
jgi:hypothetical protein